MIIMTVMIAVEAEIVEEIAVAVVGIRICSILMTKKVKVGKYYGFIRSFCRNIR
ncbi:hypothetical protein DFP93_10738 [Aneurinibacillus soli]|uniref:Uncharacterized protein n=1 Tax=Aneurinibacillus soli TaxID=1500254 RepID=A0A0U5BCN8_9BACL|nr:hypothetical protein DFP93_10738 [Aneurinibacillus soli]BAU28493.1 hypothetical protein CB4_02667 [Aneurinibacillus soli]